MLFSSSIFIFRFLPIFFIIYYIIPSRVLKNYFALVASLFFYAYGEPLFIWLMVFSIFSNYIFGLFIYKFHEKRRSKRLILATSILTNGVLFFIFKYLDFFIENINSIFQTDLPLQSIPLPIGISFFTFQAMSYVFDVYMHPNKEEIVQKNPFYLGLYVSLFPQLIAGPIVRYRTIADEIDDRVVNLPMVSEGVKFFVIGLAKKVIISNNMAIVTDYAYSGTPEETGWIFVLLGMLSYAFQIYFDFSGYSDMAIGLGKMMGFNFPMNFDYPYMATSVTNFWRRWHISLSTWFRDYVYIPLGGSRKGLKRTIVNIFLVWLLTGIWHGAAWTYIVWGLWNFLFLAIEKFYRDKNGADIEDKLNRGFTRAYAITVFIIGVNLFRTPNLSYAGNMIKEIFVHHNPGRVPGQALFFLKSYWIFYIGAILYSTNVYRLIAKAIKTESRYYNLYILIESLFLILLFYICVTFIIKGNYNPFIYFNF